MPRRPNYRFDRAERNRAEEAKKDEKLYPIIAARSPAAATSAGRTGESIGTSGFMRAHPRAQPAAVQDR